MSCDKFVFRTQMGKTYLKKTKTLDISSCDYQVFPSFSIRKTKAINKTQNINNLFDFYKSYSKKLDYLSKELSCREVKSA